MTKPKPKQLRTKRGAKPQNDEANLDAMAEAVLRGRTPNAAAVEIARNSNSDVEATRKRLRGKYKGEIEAAPIVVLDPESGEEGQIIAREDRAWVRLARKRGRWLPDLLRNKR